MGPLVSIYLIPMNCKLKNGRNSNFHIVYILSQREKQNFQYFIFKKTKSNNKLD